MPLTSRCSRMRSSSLPCWRPWKLATADGPSLLNCRCCRQRCNHPAPPVDILAGRPGSCTLFPCQISGDQRARVTVAQAMVVLQYLHISHVFHRSQRYQQVYRCCDGLAAGFFDGGEHPDRGTILIDSSICSSPGANCAARHARFDTLTSAVLDQSPHIKK